METTSNQTQCPVFKRHQHRISERILTVPLVLTEYIFFATWRICVLILLSMESLCNVLLFPSNKRFIIQVEEYEIELI